MAGGNGPNSVSWIENGLIMVVLGPSSSFDATRAIAAARAAAQIVDLVDTTIAALG